LYPVAPRFNSPREKLPQYLSCTPHPSNSKLSAGQVDSTGFSVRQPPQGTLPVSPYAPPLSARVLSLGGMSRSYIIS
jgi:hypothetical protein